MPMIRCSDRQSFSVRHTLKVIRDTERQTWKQQRHFDRQYSVFYITKCYYYCKHSLFLSKQPIFQINYNTIRNKTDENWKNTTYQHWHKSLQSLHQDWLSVFVLMRLVSAHRHFWEAVAPLATSTTHNATSISNILLLLENNLLSKPHYMQTPQNRNKPWTNDFWINCRSDVNSSNLWVCC